MIRLILAFAVLAGLAVLALPDVGWPGSGATTAEVLRERECRVLKETVGRRIQETPQRMDEVETYEWCERGATIFLVQRTFWRIDGHSTRNEATDTPSSHGKVLWERGEPVPMRDYGG